MARVAAVGSTLRGAVLALLLCFSLVVGGGVGGRQVADAGIQPPDDSSVREQDTDATDLVEKLSAAYFVEEYGIDEAEALTRVRRSDEIGELIDTLRLSLGPTFGSAYVDHEHNGVLVVQGTDEIRLEDAVAPVLSVVDEHRLTIRTEVVEYSEAELFEAQERAADGLRDRGLLNDVVIRSPSRLNRVTIDLPEPAVAAKAGWTKAKIDRLQNEAADVAEQLGPIAVVRSEEIAVDGHEIACRAEYSVCDVPLRGAQWINPSSTGSGAGDCTVSYVAFSRIDLKMYAMTAGHCDYLAAKTWYTYMPKTNKIHTLGASHRMEHAVNNGHVDAGLVRVANPSGWQYGRGWVPIRLCLQPCIYNHFESRIRRIGTSWTGRPMCTTGAATKLTKCGEVKNINVTHYVQHLAEVEGVPSCKGDSGAPVFNGDTALGLAVSSSSAVSYPTIKFSPITNSKTVECSSGYTLFYYQGITAAQDELNVNILLAQD